MKCFLFSNQLKDVSEGYPKLREIVVEENLLADIASLLEITEKELMDKLKGENGCDFNQHEAIQICYFFNLSPDKIF